jgi:hypothetical protein
MAGNAQGDCTFLDQRSGYVESKKCQRDSTNAHAIVFIVLQPTEIAIAFDEISVGVGSRPVFVRNQVACMTQKRPLVSHFPSASGVAASTETAPVDSPAPANSI